MLVELSHFIRDDPAIGGAAYERRICADRRPSHAAGLACRRSDRVLDGDGGTFASLGFVMVVSWGG